MLRYGLGRDPWVDPFYHLQKMQEEMNRVFGTFSGPATTSEYPGLNVWTSEEGMIITAEIPGVSPSDIEVTVHNNTLTLKGKRAADVPGGEGMVWHRREREAGPFTRTIALPFNVDAAKVEATFRNGVVKVVLPRPEAEKPRRIQIAAA